MITYSDIKKALEHLKMPSKRYSKALHKQLAMSLEIYISRGEFSLDGNIYEAAACLELDGYEVQTNYKALG